MAANTKARLVIAVAAAGLIFCGLALAAAEERPAPRRHTVTIDATSYSPKTLTVSVGDTVEWVNRDAFPHTATAETGGFDSGNIRAGKSWTYTVKDAGLFAYTCTYHPTMKGTLRIR